MLSALTPGGRPAARPAQPAGRGRRPARSSAVRPAAILEATRAPSPSRSAASPNKSSLADELAAKLTYEVGAAPGAPLTPITVYRGVAASVRERLIDGRNATQAHWE